MDRGGRTVGCRGNARYKHYNVMFTFWRMHVILNIIMFRWGAGGSIG